ncbi:RNA polymerase II-associated protein 1 [Uranotaenia lowii]|uniref:RNA polymerase II-associated protein 1 n=1 Tax=Uranotaenia lowii TaxID=190385 RepID=UPI00247895CD|nr:RNA polymerase II-associated protein 1 [Uranotaenia lowii]
MIKRPSSKDNENDILRMQQEFLADSQRKQGQFQPAAKVVRLQRDGGVKGAPGPSGKAPRQSEFARKRNHQKANLSGDASKNNVPEHTIIGEIVEKTYCKKNIPMEVDSHEDSIGKGAFPKPIHLKVLPSTGSGPKKQSLFAQMFQLEAKQAIKKSDEKESQAPAESTILEGSESREIHEENLEKMKKMNEEEILNEQKQLLSTMDPKLVDFLKNRKKVKAVETNPLEEEPTVEKVEPKKEILPDLAVLEHEGADQWINFDILEPEKLEWTKNIELSVKQLKPGETYEARFDWKGILQPYVAEKVSQEKDDRELYLHGEDAQRPGYTLQELFRLARANVLQQRISALNSIAGILNIFNQGFYDGILELPISKIFFFLRFALDENTPTVVEVASKALAYLFYNDTDETLLDTIYDTERGIYQPEMGLNVTHSRSEEEEKTQQNLQSTFDSLNLKDKNPKSKTSKKVQFQAQLDDDPDDLNNRETMNDFHLAETDLMECFIRTNILERIRYILFKMKPEGTTAISCVKLLIRLARTNESIAAKVASNEQLMGGLIRGYLGISEEEAASGRNHPQYLVIKLLRVLCAYPGGFYERYLSRYYVDSLLKRFVFTRRDINVKLVQTQIEAFRFFRLFIIQSGNQALYCDLLPAALYLLEWHYQHLSLEDPSGPFIIRQHCAALLALIGCPGDPLPAAGPSGFNPQSLDRLFACFCKWFNVATRFGANEFSQKLVLGACLGVARRVRSIAGSSYRNFVERYLTSFIRSAQFDEMMKSLSNTLLFHEDAVEDRCTKIPSLPNLGGILCRESHPSGAPTLILAKSYPIFLLHPLLLLLKDHAADQSEADRELLLEFMSKRFLTEYLTGLADCVSMTSTAGSSIRKSSSPKTITSTDGAQLAVNWFSKPELYFILELLLGVMVPERWKSSCSKPEDESDGCRLQQLKLAFKVLLHLSEEFHGRIVQLFDRIVFAVDFYRHQLGGVGVEVINAEELQRWKFNYKIKLQTLLKNQSNVLESATENFTVVEWRVALLGRTWPYSLLYSLLEKLEQNKPRLEHSTEEQIIRTSLLFSELVETQGAIRLATVSQKLMYLMTAFLGPDSKFLDAQISPIISRRIEALRQETLGQPPFELETRLEGRKSFQGLYQLVLDVFQSSSYGFAPFAALVMVPLAQRYDIQWRNLVWSEHVAVLRFITCSENELFGTLDDYLQPEETDTTLVRFYSQALNSNLLRPSSIPARIAAHHVRAFRSRLEAAQPGPGSKR